MGDVADAMLDGTLCAGCGVFMNLEPTGYPVYCTACNHAEFTAHEKPRLTPRCSCGKRFKTDAALADHRKATKHEARALRQGGEG